MYVYDIIILLTNFARLLGSICSVSATQTMVRDYKYTPVQSKTITAYSMLACLPGMQLYV